MGTRGPSTLKGIRNSRTNWFTRFTALSGILKARVSERKRENAGANLNAKLELSGVLLKVARLRDGIGAKIWSSTKPTGAPTNKPHVITVKAVQFNNI
jgi:hypothetical protein